MTTDLTNRIWTTVGSAVTAASDVTPGANVAVVRSRAADPTVASVIAAAAEAKGATVTQHVYPSFDVWRDTFYLPDPIHAAIRSCDVLISHPYLSAPQFQWSKTVFGAMMDKGIGHLSFSPSAEVLAGPVLEWPHELAIAISKVLADRLFGADREIHITDDRGTDLRMIGSEAVTHPTPPSALQAAQPELGDESPWGNLLRIHPVGEIGWHPFDSAEGTFVIDAIDGYGVLEAPLTWHIEDGAVAAVTGGREADHFQTAIDRYAPEGCRHLLAEASFGFNPKCTWERGRRGIAGLLPMAGTFHVAMGISTNKAIPPEATPTHVDALNRAPKVRVDDEIIMENGRLRLLDDLRKDSAVRDIAAKYGDPDLLLSEGTTDW